MTVLKVNIFSYQNTKMFCLLSAITPFWPNPTLQTCVKLTSRVLQMASCAARATHVMFGEGELQTIFSAFTLLPIQSLA